MNKFFKLIYYKNIRNQKIMHFFLLNMELILVIMKVYLDKEIIVKEFV